MYSQRVDSAIERCTDTILFDECADRYPDFQLNCIVCRIWCVGSLSLSLFCVRTQYKPIRQLNSS